MRMRKILLVLVSVFMTQMGLRAQTTFDIVSFATLNLDGNVTLEICPGSSHDLTFSITTGQLNAFQVAEVRIVDGNNGANPINNSVVGSFPNGASDIIAPSAPITVTVDIPSPISTSDYLFYIFAPATAVTPPPVVTDTVERSIIPNPRSVLVLDTASVRFDNVFLTDTTAILKSFDAFTGPIGGGIDLIPPSATPVPDRKDSTINFCNGDSLYIWNPDSLTANEHIWLLNGAPLPVATPNEGHIWVYQSGYYSLMTERANTCEDSAAYIGVGEPSIFGSTFTAGTKGVYFHTYDVDTTLQRIGVGNAVGKPTRFCRGDSVILQARQFSSHPLGSYSYAWVDFLTGDTLSDQFQLVVKQPGDYFAFIRETIGTNFSCEVFTNTVTVEVDPIPGSEIGTPGNTLCFGDTLTVQDTNFYVESNLYEWFVNGQSMFPMFGDTNLVRLDTTALISFGIGADSIATFTLVVTDTLGCDSVSLPVSFNFVRYPRIQFTSSDTLRLCQGDSVIVQAFTTNNVPSVFTWFDSPGGNVVSNNANLKVKDDGVFYAKAVGPNGCESYDTLYVFDLSIFADAGPDQTIDSGAVAQLNGSGGVSYYWYANKPVYFNNPFDPKAQTIPTSDTTTYYVEVVGANGCVDIDSMRIFIKYPVRPVDPNLIYSNIQNVVTPNGDGINDGLDLSEIMAGDRCELTIINRWGSEVFKTANYSNNWEGADSGGNPLPDGTYYYIMRCPNDDFRLKGAVTIIRSQP
jgi:gliding motility-associated-like protein